MSGKPVQSADRPWRWILLFMWNNHKYVIWKPRAMFPSLYLEIRLTEVSERLWTLEPWQSTKDRCQAVIPGNKWDYICRLFDSEWSLGKYEPSLLVLSPVCQPHNLFCCFVLASLHTRGQAEPIDCQIAVMESQPPFTSLAVAETATEGSADSKYVGLAGLYDLYSSQRSVFWHCFKGSAKKEKL